MGDVAPGRTARDRGQLLIITALSLAVLLALLTLALNTAVFGGVHAAQADDSLREERNAVGYRDALRRGVAGLIPTVNDDDGNVEYHDLRSALEGQVAAWTGTARGAHARDGAATNASVTGVTYETEIIQNTSGTFVDQSDNTSWTVAGSVSNVSGYDMNVSDDGEELAEVTDCTGASVCFTLAVGGGGGNTWRLFLHDEGADGDVDVAVETASGVTESCAPSDTPVQLNVTQGTVEGGCTFTSFRDDPNLDPPYTLAYENAGNVSGTYNLTVTGRLASTIGTDGDTGDGRYGTTGSPRLDPRITATNVTVGYRSSGLTYRAEVRITPGDTDD